MAALSSATPAAENNEDTRSDDTTSSSESGSEANNKSRSRKRKRRRNRKKKLNRKKKKLFRRKKSDPQLKSDKKAVNAEVMALLDRQYLAPKDSPLFGFNYRKGTQVLKSNPELNMELFKHLTRALLRQLISRDLPTFNELDPTLSACDLQDRYFLAMVTLVKKRRAIVRRCVP